MSSLIQKQKNLMIFAPELLLESNWAYLQSHEMRAANQNDMEFLPLEAQQSTFFSGANKAGRDGSMSQRGNLSQSAASQGGNKGNKREVIDRLAGVIDTEDPRFEKLKLDNLKHWEQGVQSLCTGMKTGVHCFYQRKASMYAQIMQSVVDKREENTPDAYTDEIYEELAQLTSQPWTFQTIPGTTSKIQNWSEVTQAAELAARLNEQAPLALWNEPLDLLNGGVEFMDNMTEFLLKQVEQTAKTQDAAEIAETRQMQSEALKCLFGAAILTGNHEFIIKALDSFSTYEQKCEWELGADAAAHTKAVFDLSEGALKSFLEQIVLTVQRQPYQHMAQKQHVSGVFGIASQFSTHGQLENNTTITSDGKYLYLYIGIHQRSYMYKIGTGEQNTIAGKVYLSVPTTRDGDITWVHCQGKLYSRRVNEEFGQLQVYDPETLKLVTTTKIFLSDIFTNQKTAEQINKNYPLLTDGDNLFIVTAEVVTKRRKLKDDKQEEFVKLSKAKTEQPKKNGEEAKKPEGETNTQSEAIKRKQEKMSRKKGKKDDGIQMTMAMKDAPAKPAGAAVTLNTDVAAYKVVQFQLHQFDVSAKSEVLGAEFLKISDRDLLQDVMVEEMYQAFSGFFKPQDCARALKYNSGDIEKAAQWLVNEKQTQKDNKIIKRSRSQFLCESLISNAQQAQRSENFVKGGEVFVKEDSFLLPTAISCGSWTLSGDYLTYHHFRSRNDDDQIVLFSTKELTTEQRERADHLQKSQRTKESGLKGLVLDLAQYFWTGEAWETFADLKALQGTVERLQKKSKDAKLTKEDILKKVLKSESSLYEPVKLESNVLRIIKNQKQLDQSYATYLTYDHSLKKFFAYGLGSASRHVIIMEDMAQLLPREQASPLESTIANTLSEFSSLALTTLNWANQRRFQMPWRWSQWSNTYQTVLNQLEQLESDKPTPSLWGSNHKAFMPPPGGEGLPTLRRSQAEPLRNPNEIKIQEELTTASDDESERELQETKKASIKRLKRRLKQIKDKEFMNEFKRLGLNLATPEQAAKYKAKATKAANARTQLNDKMQKAAKAAEEAEKIAENVHKKAMIELEEEIRKKQKKGEPAFSQELKDRMLTEQMFEKFGGFDDPAKNRLLFEDLKPPGRGGKVAYRGGRGGATFASRGGRGGASISRGGYMGINQALERDNENFCPQCLNLLDAGLDYCDNCGLDIFRQGLGNPFAQAQAQAQAQFHSGGVPPSSGFGTYKNTLNTIQAKLHKPGKEGGDSKVAQAFRNPLVLPKEKICIPRENRKVYAFCTTGSITVLETLFKWVKAAEEVEDSLYQAILDAVIFADILSAYQIPSVLDELADLLQERVQSEKVSESAKQLIWRALVVGWYMFARTTHQQLRLLQFVLDHSKSAKSKASRQEESSEKPEALGYYTRLLTNKAHLAPIEILSLRFFNYQASFYPLEILTQSKVEPHLFLLKSKDLYLPVTQPSSSTQPNLSQFSNGVKSSEKKQESSPSSKVNEGQEKEAEFVKTLKPQFYRYTLPEDRFSSYELSDSSITEVPIDYIELEKQKRKSFEFPFSISHLYFAAPLPCIFTQELIDHTYDQSELDVEMLASFYSTEKPDAAALENAKDDAKALHEIKYQHLDKLRTQQTEMQEKLLGDFMQAAIQSMLESSSDDQQGYFFDETKTPALIKSFSHLLELSLNWIDWHSPVLANLPLKVIKFIDEAVQAFSRRTNNFKNLFKGNQKVWIESFRELIWMAINSLQLCYGTVCMANVAYECIPQLLSVIENLKKLFNYTHAKKDKKTGQPVEKHYNILEKMKNSNSEGVDFANELSWETPHPYPKTGVAYQHSVKIPRAIAYVVEFDKRTSFQSTNDVLVLKSAEYSHNLNDYFGTKLRISSKPHQGQPYIVFGSKLEIDFRIFNPRQGRKPAATGGSMSAEETAQRWGFRITIRPILDGTLSLNIKLKDYMEEQIFARVATKDALQDWFGLLNQLTFLSSTLSSNLVDGNMIKANPGSNGLHPPPIASVFENQLSQPFQPFERNNAQQNQNQHDGEAENKNAANSILNWHLFRGGLKLIEFEDLSPQQYLKAGLEVFNQTYHSSQKIILKKLEEYVEKPEPKEMTKKLKLKQKSESKPASADQDEEWKANRETWTQEVINLLDEEGNHELLKQVVNKIRKTRLVPYNQMYERQWMMPSFKVHLQKWHEVERILVLAMLYHSDSISDCAKFLEIADVSTDAEHSNEEQSLIQEFTMIGKQVNIILMWMLNRLSGQKEFNNIIDDILGTAQTMIDARVLQKKELSGMAVAESETRKYLHELKEEEKKKAKEQAEEEEKKKLSAQKKPAVVSKSKGSTLRGKQRKNIARIAPAQPLPKAQSKKASAQKKAESVEKIEEKKEEESKDDLLSNKSKTSELVEDEEPEVVFLNLKFQELNDLKNKIYGSAYQDFLDKYQNQNDMSKLMQLCMFFNLELNATDVNETLKQIFKRVKSRIRQILDFDGPQPIPETLSKKTLNLGSPSEEVARDVHQRVIFLFEIRSSLSYQSEVTKIGGVSLQKASTYQGKKKMAVISEEAEEDQLSQQMSQQILQMATENSQIDEAEGEEGALSDLSEDLQPIDMQRSYSVPTTAAKHPASHLGVPGANKMTGPVQVRKPSADYSDWIESYRKWRQWNKKGTEEEEDLLSPFVSPLQGVASFAKQSQIFKPSVLRKIMGEHQQRAAFRLFGLQQQAKLNTICQSTSFNRFTWGNQSSTLSETVLHQVQTCGVTLTKQINASSRTLVQQLMHQVVTQIESYIDRRKAQDKAYAEKREKNRSEKKEKVEKIVEKSSATETKAVKHSSSSTLRDHEQSMFTEDLKKLLHQLNDIRVLLSDVYTREYVLESLRQDHLISTKDKLGGDQIANFLKATVHILVNSQKTSTGGGGSWSHIITKLQFQISYVAKLVLYLFISQDKKLIRQTETQRILQEMLLDIVVSQLEGKCFTRNDKDGVSKVVTSKMHKTSCQDEQIQLLKLLSQIIRTSNDTQHLIDEDSENDPVEKQQVLPSFFLAAGSQKVQRCAQLLAFMLHNVQVPLVTRLIIKCARLLYQVVDLQKLETLHTTESQKVSDESQEPQSNLDQREIKFSEFILQTMQTIGAKISNQASSKVAIDGPSTNSSSEKTQTEKSGGELAGSLDLESEGSPAASAAVQEASASIEEVVVEEEEKKEIIEEEEKKDEEEKDKDEEAESKTEEKKMDDASSPKEDSSTDKKGDSERKYVVYANLNIPKEEDYTFIVTALYHWYAKYPAWEDKFVKDPSEIVVQVADTHKTPAKKTQQDASAKSKSEEKLKEQSEKKDASSSEQKESEKPVAKIKEGLISVMDLIQGLPGASAEIQASREEASNILKEAIQKESESKAEMKLLELQEAELAMQELAKLSQQEKEKMEAQVLAAVANAEDKEWQTDSNASDDQDPDPMIGLGAGSSPPSENPNNSEAKEVEIEIVGQNQSDYMNQMKSIMESLEDPSALHEIVEIQRKQAELEKELVRMTTAVSPSAKKKSYLQAAVSKKQPEAVPSHRATAASYARESSKHMDPISKGLTTTNAKINRFYQVFAEAVKLTYKAPLSTDSDDIKLQKMNEKNYNINLTQVLKAAVQISAHLYARNSFYVTSPITHSQALELSELLVKAYRGQLDPIQVNPYVKGEELTKKIPSAHNLAYKQLFPITPEKVIQIQQKDTQKSPVQPDNIKVAPNKFIATICEKSSAQSFESEVNSCISFMKTQSKLQTTGNSVGHVLTTRQESVKQGPSISIVIQELIQLVRSLTSSSLGNPSSADNTKIFRNEVLNLFNESVKLLATKSWDTEIQNREKEIILGVLAVVGGWQPQIQTGQPVRVEINNSWCAATVVDDGQGKQRISVILDDDDQLQIIKIAKKKVQPIQEFKLDLGGDFGTSLDQKSLCEAIIKISKSSSQLDTPQKLAENDKDLFTRELLSSDFLLSLLLKTSSQLRWTFMESQDSVFTDFVQILIQISRGEGVNANEQAGDVLNVLEEDKSKVHWEKSLIQSWERLIDKSEIKNQQFYSPKEFTQLEEIEAVKQGVEGESKPKADASGNALVKNLQLYSENQYNQMKNSYLGGLPPSQGERNQSEANLKLLHHWERNLIPEIIKYCAGTYRPYEFEYYFEQVRHHLKKGDSMSATNDALTMLEHKSNLIFPDENYDWSVKIIDECQVDAWALAKIRQSRSTSQRDGGKTENTNTSMQGVIGSSGEGEGQSSLLNKLFNLGIDEILVQIKAIEGRGNMILAEYVDQDTMTVHQMWVPIMNLVSISSPLPPKAIGFSQQTLSNAFSSNVTKIASVYARQTLVQFFQGFEQKQLTGDNEDAIKLPVENLRLEELISWSVWESFTESPFYGWMTELSSAIKLNNDGDSSQSASTAELTPTPTPTSEQINTTQDTVTIDQQQPPPTLAKILEQNLDQIANETLQNQELVKQKRSKEGDSGPSAGQSSLNMFKSLFSRIASNLDDSASGQKGQNDFMKLKEIVDWTVTNWFQMAYQISEERAVVDICQEFEKHRGFKSDIKNANSTELLPLHELLPGRGVNSVGTLLMFKKSGTQLAPCSKVQFFSDCDMVNLVQEISAGNQIKTDLEPYMLNYGTIWVSFEAGTVSLLPKSEQVATKSTLECAVIQIPKQWTVCCWLTEVLTSTLLKDGQQSAPKYVLEVLNKLISALISFYLDSKAPTVLKSVILKLLARLMNKLRCLYHSTQQANKDFEFKASEHFSRLFLTTEFIEHLLSELLVQFQTEQHSPDTQLGMASGSESILYPAFVQDALEFLMTVFVPTSKTDRINSFVDLLPQKDDKKNAAITLPDWIRPLIRVSYFLHYFRGEMCLPNDMLLEIHANTKLGDQHLDNILVINKLPTKNAVYNKEWILNKVHDLLETHMARVLDPAQDIVFVTDEEDPENYTSIVLVLDGWHQFRPNTDVDPEDKNEKHIKLLSSETDDDEDIEESSPDKPEEKPAEEATPEVWACPTCTLENPIGHSVCSICEQRRPPMDQIMAVFRATMESVNTAAPKDQDGKKEGEDKGPEVEQPEHKKRLQMLARDLRHMISHDQKVQLLAEIQKQKELKEAADKKAEEEKAKEEEEKAKAEEQKKPEEVVKEEERKDDKPEIEKEDEVKISVVRRNSSHVRRDSSHIIEHLSAQGSDHTIENSDLDDLEHDESVDSDWVDLENLPGDRGDRFDMLGIDRMLLDTGDEDLIQVMEQSKIQDLRDQQDKKKVEKAAKEKERQKERKRKEREEQKKALADCQSSIDPIKMNVLFGQKAIFEDNLETGIIVQNFLRERLRKKTDSDGKEGLNEESDFEFSDHVITILKQIHANFKTFSAEELSLPENEMLLEDFDFTPDTLKEVDFESLQEMFLSLALADTRLLFKIFESQGVDLWLTQAALPSHIPEHCGQAGQKVINVQLLEKLRLMIEQDICEEKKAVLNLEPLQLRLVHKLGNSDIVMKADQKPIGHFDDFLISSVYPEISEKLSQAEIRYMWSLLLSFNKIYAPAVPMINMAEPLSDIPENAVPMTIAAYMSQTRDLCLDCVKADLRYLILEKTTEARESVPKIYLERLKMQGGNQNNDDSDHRKSATDLHAVKSSTGQESNSQKDKRNNNNDFSFLVAFDQLKEIDLAVLRPKKPQGAEPHLAFEIVFVGEKVEGEGGPYRQFFSDLAQELQPTKLEQGTSGRLLNLLVPSANQNQNEQIGRDRFVLNSQRVSAQDLSLYEFIGILMGICIRTGAKLGLQLPQLIWKQFVGQKVSFDDLLEVDQRFVDKIKNLLRYSKKEFDENANTVTWVTTLADDSIFDLTDEGVSGDKRPLKYEDRFEYVRRALLARLKESQPQCMAIKRGISKIIPEALLNMCTFKELETWVCGKKFIDLDLLERHTIYSGKNPSYSAEHPTIKMFWKMLRLMTKEELKKFIKFCWGQEVIPSNDEEFKRQNVRFQIKSIEDHKGKNQDERLPGAGTCFFNFSLPNFSTIDIMRQKVMQAVNLDCISMNAEENEVHQVGGHANNNRDRMFSEESY